MWLPGTSSELSCNPQVDLQNLTVSDLCHLHLVVTDTLRLLQGSQGIGASLAHDTRMLSAHLWMSGVHENKADMFSELLKGL